MICLILIIMVIFINGIENAEQKVKHLHTVLKEEDIDAKTKAWLLMVESGRVDNEEMRRITPKSIFIAPLLTNPAVKCRDGYRFDHLGQCVKVFQPDPKLQLELLLKKLNKLYSEKKEEENDKRISEPSNGPLQFSIPVSINIDKETPSSPNINTESESLKVDKAHKIQVERNQTFIKPDSLQTDLVLEKMQVEDKNIFIKPDILEINSPSKVDTLQIKKNSNSTNSNNVSTKAVSPEFSTPESIDFEKNITLSKSDAQTSSMESNDKFSTQEQIQIKQNNSLPAPFNKLDNRLLNRPHYFSTPGSSDIDKSIKLFNSDSFPRPFGFYNKLFASNVTQFKNNYTFSTTSNETLHNGSPQFSSPLSVNDEKNVKLFNLETQANLFEVNDKSVVEEKTQTAHNISSLVLGNDENPVRSESLTFSLPALDNTTKNSMSSYAFNESYPPTINNNFFTTENLQTEKKYNLSYSLSSLNNTLNNESTEAFTTETIITEKSTLTDLYGEQEYTEPEDEAFPSEKIPSSSPAYMTDSTLENTPFEISTPSLIDVESEDSDPVLSSTETDSDFLDSTTILNTSPVSDKLFITEKVQEETNTKPSENYNLPIPLKRLNGTFSVSVLTEPSHKPLQFSIPVSIDVEKNVKSAEPDAIIKRLNGTFSLLIG